MIHRFEVPGPLLGYRASAREAHAHEYSAFKTKVRLLANVARVPPAIELPDEARLRVLILWRAKARIDGKNVYAAIEDALFLQDRGMAAACWTRFEGRGEERAVVWVEYNRGTRGTHANVEDL